MSLFTGPLDWTTGLTYKPKFNHKISFFQNGFWMASLSNNELNVSALLLTGALTKYEMGAKKKHNEDNKMLQTD